MKAKKINFFGSNSLKKHNKIIAPINDSADSAV